jgi:hypothetical protein
MWSSKLTGGALCRCSRGLGHVLFLGPCTFYSVKHDLEGGRRMKRHRIRKILSVHVQVGSARGSAYWLSSLSRTLALAAKV